MLKQLHQLIKRVSYMEQNCKCRDCDNSLEIPTFANVTLDLKFTNGSGNEFFFDGIIWTIEEEITPGNYEEINSVISTSPDDGDPLPIISLEVGKRYNIYVNLDQEELGSNYEIASSNETGEMQIVTENFIVEIILEQISS